MPSADQVNILDKTGAQSDDKRHSPCNGNADSTNHMNQNNHETHGLKLHNGSGAISSMSKENGNVTMETVNAHLIKSGGVICLDRNPVKPVIIATNGTENTVPPKPMENGEEVMNGSYKDNAAEESIPNGKQETDKEARQTSGIDHKPETVQSTDIPSAAEDKERSDRKLSTSKKPASFDLLPFEISKTRTPSRRGKLARQRTVSETSHEKVTHRLEHAKSDPTDLRSVSEEQVGNNGFNKEEDGKSKDKKEVEEKLPGQKDSLNKKEKEVDALAEQLGSALKLASDKPDAECKDKEVSDLADDLQKGLSVTDEAKDDGSKIKQEASETSPEKVFVKEEQEEKEKSSTVVIKKEHNDKDSTSEVVIKKEPVDSENSSTSFKDRISEDKPVEMISKGPIGSTQQHQIPMTSYSGQQRMPHQSCAIVIPSFQDTFIQNPQHHNQMAQGMQQQQAWLQKQHQVQHVQPPYYCGPNSVPHRQPINVPPLAQNSQTIIVPPAGSQNTMQSTPYVAYSTMHQLQQMQQHQQQLQQQQRAMPLQQQQPIHQHREPVEVTWPLLPDALEDAYSETSSNVCSPPQIDDIDQLHSPHSAMSETSSTPSDFMGLSPVSPLISSHGSPPTAGSYTGSSPYHRVPSSPEMSAVLSPTGVPSPASPTSQQIITTKGHNMGVVTLNDPAGKPSSPKRQCLEGDDSKQKSISDLVDYLKSGSPGSPVFESPSSDDPPQMTPPQTMQQHTIMTETEAQQTTSSPQTTQYNRQSVSDQYCAAASPSQSTSSCDTPSPSPNPSAYQPDQPSPPPGMSPVVVQPYRATPAPQYYPYGVTHSSIMPQTQLMRSAPNMAMTPTQGASHQGVDLLQEWRQKVGRLTDAQLREQDDDKDTVLHVAIIQEQDHLTQALVERVKFTEAMNMKNKLSQTPLYVAALINRPDIVHYLLQSGADPTIPAEQAGNTALHHAAKHGYVDVIKAIIQGYGRSTNDFMDRKNFEGKSPLHYAVEAHGEKDSMSDQTETIDSLQTIQILMSHGASAMCQDGKSGKTPLHYAIEMHKIDISQLLLNMCDNAGELVNCQTYNGNTALHLVVGRREIPQDQILEVVALLMNRGANVSIENAERDTALRLLQPGHDVIKKHLQGQAHDGSRR